MSSDLIAWIVAVTLGLAVVGLGLRRDLSDVTRSWLPRFGETPEPVTATPESPYVDKGVVSFPLGKGGLPFGAIC